MSTNTMLTTAETATPAETTITVLHFVSNATPVVTPMFTEKDRLTMPRLTTPRTVPIRLTEALNQ